MRVFKSPRFQKKVEKLLSKSGLKELSKFIADLKQGKKVGKPVSYDFFREKKIGDKRIFFLVYKDISLILLVGSSDKKMQQETIDEIRCLLPEFKRYAYKLYEEN